MGIRFLNYPEEWEGIKYRPVTCYIFREIAPFLVARGSVHRDASCVSQLLAWTYLLPELPSTRWFLPISGIRYGWHPAIPRSLCLSDWWDRVEVMRIGRSIQRIQVDNKKDSLSTKKTILFSERLFKIIIYLLRGAMLAAQGYELL